jgi:hypothetical protein
MDRQYDFILNELNYIFRVQLFIVQEPHLAFMLKTIGVTN